MTKTGIPGAGGTARGDGGASLDSEHLHNRQANHPRKSLTARVSPSGDPRSFAGRLAQTLELLIERGPRGISVDEAASLGWARRLSDYVFKLRRLGIPITTTRENRGDATVGRYTLAVQMVVLIGSHYRNNDSSPFDRQRPRSP